MIRTAIATATVTALAPLTLLSATAHASDVATEAGADRHTAQARPSAERAARPWARHKRRVKIKVSADTGTAIAGEETVTFTGRVKPKRLLKGAKRKVVLQQRLDGKRRWKRTDKIRLRNHGRFVLSDSPSAPGTRHYRVMVPGGKGIKKSFSEELTVVVYRWESLATWAPGPKSGVELQTAVIGTRHLGGSFVTKTAGTPGFVEYTLGRRCVSLVGTYALTDYSPSGSTGTARLTVDGKVAVDQPLVVGSVNEVTTDVTGAFRVRFDLAGSETPAGQAAAAGVQVLCTK